MSTVKDIIVKKPSNEELATAKTWAIWKSEPSKFEWEYTEKETCFIIEGQVTVKDDNDSISFKAGDMVIFPKDLSCTWHITEAVVKNYNFS